MNISVVHILIFFFGAIAGGLLVWLWIEIRGSYKRARGLMQAREKANAEKAKQTKKAREDIAKGRREMLRTALYFLLAIALVGILATSLALLS